MGSFGWFGGAGVVQVRHDGADRHVTHAVFGRAAGLGDADIHVPGRQFQVGRYGTQARQGEGDDDAGKFVGAGDGQPGRLTRHDPQRSETCRRGIDHPIEITI
jgi:hypothetical protein